MGPPIPLFSTSGDVYPGFRGQGGSFVCFHACVNIRFTSGATPAYRAEVIGEFVSNSVGKK